MRKYYYIFKTEVMSNITYISDILFGFIGYFIVIYIFLNLWQYLYSDPSEVINGYTMNQMIWYVIVTEIIWSVVGGRKLCRRITDDVKSGNIAYNINKPYSYIGYIVSTHLGVCAVRSVLYILLGMVVGYLFLGSFPQLSLLSILLVIISFILSIVINILFTAFIGLFAFVFEDSTSFYWIWSKLILVIGTTFPIEFFPLWARNIIKYSPIYAVCYGPAKLFVDYSNNSFYSVIISQVCYLVIGYLLCKAIYKKGVKNINVNGG